MSPERDDKSKSTQTHGIGGGGGGPRTVGDLDVEVGEVTDVSHEAITLIEDSRSVSSVDLSVGEAAPASLNAKERGTKRQHKKRSRSPSQEPHGFPIDLEALKIFVILTALTVAMVVAARWIV